MGDQQTTNRPLGDTTRDKKDRWAALLWLSVHLVLFLVIANHSDERPMILGRYSVAYAAFLLGVLVAGFGGLIIVRRLGSFRPGLPMWLERARATGLFRVVVVSITIALALVIWLTPFTIEIQPLQKELVRVYGTLALMGAVVALLYWRAPDPPVRWRGWVVMGACFGGIALVIALLYLDRFPQLNQIDELHNWVVQWTYANTGLLGDALYRQMIPLPQPIYDSPHYIAGLLLRLIGDSFWQARFARLLMSCVALPFIYLAGKRMYGRRAGLLAVVVALFYLPPTAYVRPDVFVGVMLSVAIYVYVRAQTTRRPWMHYLAGLTVALGGEGHPLAYRFGLAFAVLYGLRWLNEMRLCRRLKIDGRLFALGLGGLTGMMIYLSIHILPGLEQGLHFARNYSPVSMTLEKQVNAGFAIIENQLYIWVTTSPFEFILVTAGIALAFWRFEDGDRLLLTLLIVSQGLMIATYGYYREFYQVHFLPIYTLVAGRLLATLTMKVEEWRAGERLPGRLSGFTVAVMVFALSSGNLLHSAQVAEKDVVREEFTSIARQLKATLPSDAIVVGNENYFIEMRSLNYYGIQTITTDNWWDPLESTCRHASLSIL